MARASPFSRGSFFLPTFPPFNHTDIQAPFRLLYVRPYSMFISLVTTPAVPLRPLTSGDTRSFRCQQPDRHPWVVRWMTGQAVRRQPNHAGWAARTRRPPSSLSNVAPTYGRRYRITSSTTDHLYGHRVHHQYMGPGMLHCTSSIAGSTPPHRRIRLISYADGFPDLCRWVPRRFSRRCD